MAKLLNNTIATIIIEVIFMILLLIIALAATPEELINISLPANWVGGAISIVLAAVISIATKKIDLPGAIAGVIIAFCIFLGGGYTSLLFLLVFFISGSFASRLGIKRKAELGLAQENKGKRSVKHAISNGGIAALAGLLAWLITASSPLFIVMLAGSLASATADTLSSELGNIYGSRYYNILSLKPDHKGKDGVVSWEGTFIGTAGSFMIAAIYALFFGRNLGFWAIAAGGIAGNFIDSILGATLQQKKFLNNDSVNFINTLFGAMIAGRIMMAFGL